VEKSKGALIIDIDGTAWRDCLEHRLAKLLLQKGLIKRAPYERALELERERRLRRIPHRTLNDEWVGANNTNGFEGVTVKDMSETARELVEHDGDEMYVWTRELIHSCGEHGYFRGAISGSSEDAVKPFCERFDFDAAIGSRYPTRDGVHVAGPGEWFAREKNVVASKMLQEYGFTPQDCVITMGDTLADFPMLEIARYPIAFEPNGELLAKLELSVHWHRPYAVVRDSKDGITVTAILRDMRGVAYERSCGLEDILPLEIAADMRRRLTQHRLGNLLRFPDARLP
jgi:phosphoserine phosphatase